MQPLRYRGLWLGGGLAALLVILGLALVPLPGPPMVHNADKLLHVLAFMFLAVWFLGVVAWQRALAVAAGLLAYGVLIEALQATTAYRMADPCDVLSDAIGIAAGWLLAAAGLRHWCRRLEALKGVAPVVDEQG